MTRTVSLLTLLVLLATSCSGGTDEPPAPGPTPDPAAIRAGLASLFVGDRADAKGSGEGACFAEALTTRATPEELREAGVLDASYDVVAQRPTLPEGLARVWVDAQFSCTDFVAASAAAQEQISHGKVDAQEYAGCLRAALDDGQLRAAVVDTLTGSWEGAAFGRLTAAQSRCSRLSRG